MKVEHAVETLGRQLLEDDRAEVRETSAWALGEIRVPAASPYLNRALDDREARVRDKARWALSEIEDSDG
jgi:HEAT repeat protein